MPDNEESRPSRETILGILQQASGVSLNVNSDWVVVTEDKLHIHIDKTLERWKKRRDWQTPLGVALPLLLAILTADTFRQFIFAPMIWKFIFVAGFAGAVAWLIISVFRCSKPETVEQIVERIKKEPQ